MTGYWEMTLPVVAIILAIVGSLFLLWAIVAAGVVLQERNRFLGGAYWIVMLVGFILFVCWLKWIGV